MNLSLRTKGQFAFVAFVIYIAIASLVLGNERQALLQVALDLEKLHARQEALTKAAQAIDHSNLRLQRLLLSGEFTSSYGDDVALDIELVQAGLQGLNEDFPELGERISSLGDEVIGLRQSPSRARLLALQQIEVATARRLDELDVAMREQRSALWARYHSLHDRMTMLVVMMNLVAALFFGTVITLFFGRLTWDIRKLRARAASVVTGYRGPLLEITRGDEVGQLMQEVNHMQIALREREQKLEIAREQHFHREKMAAMGSLAAAVAHEINNPIAAIIGIVRSMRDGKDDAPDGGRDTRREMLNQILEQAQRISGISRQIAEFTRPRTIEPRLLDLNGLVRSTCNFICYDHRLRRIDVALELDPELPAIRGVADHLTQVLMNLLINAADALEGSVAAKPTIRVTTRVEGSGVLLIIADNGHGMERATLARAFEEFFSTKPADKGRGLGLPLCKALVERDGGRIEIASEPGQGTRVTLHLPLQATVKR